jgi:serine protease
LVATTSSAGYVVQPGDGGHVLFVEVVPVSAYGGASETGVAMLSAASGVVDASAVHYTNTTDLSIPDDGSWVESTIVVNDTGLIDKLTVDVRILHTYIGDLEVEVLTPYGIRIPLHSRSGGGADDLVRDYVITVDASGREQRGVWRLRVRDVASVDHGHVDRWGLKFR